MAKKKQILPQIGNPRLNQWQDNATFISYYNRLVELSISSWKWTNLPSSMDSRFLEIGLFERGNMLLFYDEVLEADLSLPSLNSGQLDIYNIPINRQAYASNGYRYNCDNTNSVLVFNNMLMTPSFPIIYQYCEKLTVLDNIITTNIKAQKTPILITCAQNELLTMQNLYAKYDGNIPVIYADNTLDRDSLKVLKTDAPFLADRLYQLLVNTWNEALTYLGIPNVSIQKKERMISDEVQRAQGGTIASRYSREHMRQDAAEKYNRLRGTDIWVEFNCEVDTSLPNASVLSEESEEIENE